MWPPGARSPAPRNSRTTEFAGYYVYWVPRLRIPVSDPTLTSIYWVSLISYSIRIWVYIMRLVLISIPTAKIFVSISEFFYIFATRIWYPTWIPVSFSPLVTNRPTPTPDRRRSHHSPEVNLGREMQSPLARGQTLVGDVVRTRPRPTSVGDAVRTRLRPTSGGYCYNLHDWFTM
jgi:hypothetical protein